MKIFKNILLLMMISIIGIAFVGCGEDQDTGFAIDSQTQLDILNIESDVKENRQYAKITYKITGKNAKNTNMTYLHILTEEKYNQIINGDIEKLDRLSDAPKKSGDTVQNNDGSETVLLSTSFNNIKKYKAVILFDIFKKNEKAIVSDLIITEEIANRFKDGDDIVNSHNQAIQDKNNEIKEQIEEEKRNEPKKYKENVIAKMSIIGQDVINVSKAYNSGDFKSHAKSINSLIANCKSLKSLNPSASELKDIDLTVEVACDLYLESANYMSKAVLEVNTEFFKIAEQKSKKAGDYFKTVINSLSDI